MIKLRIVWVVLLGWMWGLGGSSISTCHAAEVEVTHPQILEARKMRDQGQFTKATRALERLRDAVTTGPSDLRPVIELEIEKIRRTREDYPFVRETLLKAFQKRLKDFTEKELDEAIQAGHIDGLEIDGTKRYFVSAVSNLVWRRGELQKRLIKQPEGSANTVLRDAVRSAEQMATSSGAILVDPRDWQATMTLTVPPGKVPGGQLVRAWIPYPQELDYQTSVTLVSSNPVGGLISTSDSLQRSIYLERMAVEGTTITFQASYRFRTYARVFRPEDSRVLPYPSQADSSWRQYLESRPPHLPLRDEQLRKVAREIIGETTHPLAKVRAIHGWMINNLIYQYAREYSTLDSLALYTLNRKAGDCGQHGMLFIALCRIAGVPARWTSGWEMLDPKGEAGMHDWTEVWIEPYGWIPVDTDLALLAVRHPDGSISEAEAKHISEFLVGNLDGHRLTINLDYGRPLFPPKKDFRSETVDFQRGEIEAEGRNLYFSDWDYEMEVKQIRR